MPASAGYWHEMTMTHRLSIVTLDCCLHCFGAKSFDHHLAKLDTKIEIEHESGQNGATKHRPAQATATCLRKETDANVPLASWLDQERT